MNNLDPQYINLVKDILVNGHSKEDRTGTGTKSVFSRQIRHKMSDGFPLLTTKKMPFKTIVTELLWFLRGDTNIKYLVDNNCHIWDGDAYKNYLKNCTENYKTHNKNVVGTDIPDHWKDSVKLDLSELLTQEEFIDKIKTDEEFAKKWGELGPIYGKQWRKWGTNKLESFSGVDYDGCKPIYIDQIQNSINLLKTEPDSRRNIISAWNVGEMKDMVLPPCHNFFQFYTRKLNFNTRYKIGKYQPYNIEGKVEYKKGLNYITQEQFEDFHNLEMDILGVPTRAISLMWNQRSVDTGLGLPFNIASYGLLLEIIGKMVNMVPDELIGNLGDTHLYNNHIEPIQEQLGRSPYKLPKLNFSKLFNIDIQKYSNQFNNPLALDMFISRLSSDDFILEGYESHPTIKLPLSN